MSDPADAMAILVSAIGEKTFDAAIMAVFELLAGADLCSGFAIVDDAPRVLFAVSGDPGRTAFARIASLRYAEKYWRRDQATLTTLGRAHRNVRTVRRPSSVIRDLDYRHECYAEGEVIERISICRAGPVRIIANAYRDRENGPFSQDQIEGLEAASPIIAAAIERHMKLTPLARDAAPFASASRLAHRLRGIDGLSLREAEVLAHVAGGLEQATIATDIGIAVSSVVTYRRRGYAKLGVRSRRELQARLHDLLNTR